MQRFCAEEMKKMMDNIDPMIVFAIAAAVDGGLITWFVSRHSESKKKWTNENNSN